MVLGGEKSKWIHSRESLTNGRITYTVKFMGKAEVPDSRGMPMVKAALQKLSFSRQLKRSEGAKPPKVELGISIHSVSISDIKTKETLHNIGLHRVSFCADDKEDKRLFAFIAKLDDNKHYCYGLDSIHQANDITLTIGQAFELAYEKFRREKKSVQVKESAPAVTKVTDMSRRIQELESENNELRQRIADLEAAQRRIQYGNGVTSTTSPAQVSVKPLAAPSPIQFNTENIALPRSSPAQTNPSLPSFNSTPLPTSLPTSLSSYTRSSDNSTLIDIDAVNSSLIQDSAQLKSIYTSMNRGPGDQEVRNEIGNSREQNTSSAVSSSVRKFRNSLQRNMRKTMASEEKMKKTLTSLFPSKMISKKLRKGKNEEPERKFALLDDSAGSSCSSSRSSTYANLDDVIATLQKMMDKGESTTRSSKLNRQAQLDQPASFIGEKLATHHDLAQLNYDTIPRRAPKPKEMYEQHFTNTAESNHTSVQGSVIQQPAPRSEVFLQTEVMNSNDDLSSLSTTTTDSSSRECVYVLQPTNSTTKDINARNASAVAQHHHDKTHSKKIHPKPVKYEAETRHKLAVKQMPSRQSNMRDRRDPTDHVWPGTNIDSTLRQLGGEEGYMVLSGRKQVEQILAKTPMSNFNAMEQDICVDSTYDNVSRLMEAVREAAARDAEKRGGDAKEILMTPANTKLLLNTQRSACDVHTTSWMEGGRPISTPASAHTSRNRASNSRNINTDLSTIAFGSTNPAFHNNKQVSSMVYQQSPEYLTSDGRFPTTIPFQPYSASSNRQFAYSRGMRNSQETDILYGQDQMPSPPTSLRLTSEDAFNMQPFVPPSNMSRLPQPPSRKPVKPQGDLWSHDLFDPIQKPSRTSKEVLDMQNAFSKGLVVSEENLTLDSFDPLKH